jgi:D-glycero-D-manno-heptose 1,7-bisphosphate phosphatase
MIPLLANGCWAEIRGGRQAAPRPCLFLDRDGVVIVDRHYLHDPAGVELIAGAAALVGAANRSGWLVGLVTNQSGIGRGYFDWQAFAAVQRRLEAELSAAGASLDFVCACPHLGGGIAPFDVDDHPWRKPNPGMLLHAADALGADMDHSIMVGDRASDLAAGAAAGVGRRLLFAAAPVEVGAARAAGAPFAEARHLDEVARLLRV